MANQGHPTLPGLELGCLRVRGQRPERPPERPHDAHRVAVEREAGGQVLQREVTLDDRRHNLG